ncbi:MAG: hypothetical protein ACI4PD_08535 [Butyricicoccus sp.]
MITTVRADGGADAPTPGEIKAQIIRIRQSFDRPLPGGEGGSAWSRSTPASRSSGRTASRSSSRPRSAGTR